MNSAHDIEPKRTRARTYFWGLVATWTIIIIGVFVWDVFEIRHAQREMALNEALATWRKDQTFLLWAISLGGVYAPVSAETRPNPHLKHVPERDIETPSGKDLTLMNPAYMLRLMSKKYLDSYGVGVHITALKYFQEETAPDEWEKAAIKAFERGVREVSEFTRIDGEPYLRLMRPMITQQQCLKCHGIQGYKVGDVRGGVSVSVPMTYYMASGRREIIAHSISFGILWLLGFTGISLATRRLRQRIQERDKAETELQKAHDNLELRVTKRTAELEKANEDLKREEEALRWSEQRSRLRDQISTVFLTIPDEEMYAEVLKVILDTMESEFGTFGYFDEDGSFVAPAVSREIYWDKCNVPEKEIIFKRGTFGGIWGRAIKEERTLVSNHEPFNTPEGHIPITNTMVVPIIFRDEVISAIHVANKRSGYADKDRAMLETIADHIAPVLYARIQRDRRDKERELAQNALNKLNLELEERVQQRTIELKTELTERKHAEEQIRQSLSEKGVLLREVHHRVKNNFQVISSLLDMIKMRTQNPEAIDLLTGARSKIYTMALVHTQLYEQKRFYQIDLAGHIRKLAEYLRQVYSGKGPRIDLVLEPSDVYLTLNQAIPCALVMNEVVSNAFGHAFKGAQQGTVKISVSKSDDDMVVIRVKDDGIGIPEEVDIDKTNTLGLKLVRNLVEGQLNGEVQINRDNGTEIIVEFKAATEGGSHA